MRSKLQPMQPMSGDRSSAGGGEDALFILRTTSLFESLDERHLAELVARARRRRFDADQTVFHQGDRADGLHVVLRGRVKVFKTSPKGREQTLMIMGSGEPIGEVAVLSGENYPASAETLEPTETLYVPRQAFLDLVGREPEVAMRLLSALSARLRSFASLIEDLSLKDVSQRLAAYLLSLARAEGAVETVDLDVSKTQLSGALGTVPETLSRAFQQLARAGAAETRGRKVHIKDTALLGRIAGVRPGASGGSPASIAKPAGAAPAAGAARAPAGRPAAARRAQPRPRPVEEAAAGRPQGAEQKPRPKPEAGA
jgi:CRP/FNR family transcriptional regulator, dissimilatory nitrate respiration regulator